MIGRLAYRMQLLCSTLRAHWPASGLQPTSAHTSPQCSTKNELYSKAAYPTGVKVAAANPPYRVGACRDASENGQGTWLREPRHHPKAWR